MSWKRARDASLLINSASIVASLCGNGVASLVFPWTGVCFNPQGELGEQMNCGGKEPRRLMSSAPKVRMMALQFVQNKVGL